MGDLRLYRAALLLRNTAVTLPTHLPQRCTRQTQERLDIEAQLGGVYLYAEDVTTVGNPCACSMGISRKSMGSVARKI